MKALMAWLIGILVFAGCQILDGDLYITYLVVDGGASDAGVDTEDGGSDVDTDTEAPDAGAADAGSDCTAGLCCGNDGQVYKSEDGVLCAIETFYRCLGICGSAQLERIGAEKFCDGTSGDCVGPWEGTWETLGAGGVNDACVIGGFGTQGYYVDCGTAGCDLGTELCNP